MSGPFEGMTAYIYSRVSTDDKEQDVDAQHRANRKFCKDNGIEIIGEFIEEKSAKEANRPKYREMLGGLVSDKPNMILARDNTRLHRNEKDSTELKQHLKLLRGQGINIIIRYVLSGIEPETRHGAMLDNITATIAADKVRQTSEEVQSRMDQLKAGDPTKSGIEYYYRPPPIYIIDGKPNRERHPAEKPGKVVINLDRVLEKAAAGKTLYAICKELNYPRTTTRTCLERAGVMERFNELKTGCPKGVLSERVVSSNTLDEKPPVSETVSKGTLADSQSTLSDNSTFGGA